jgi:hypothetical protein
MIMIVKQDVGGLDWIQDKDQFWAPVNTVMNSQVPQNVGTFLRNCVIARFSRRTQLHGVSYKLT